MGKRDDVAVRMEGLSFRYEESPVTALADLNLAVQAGGCFIAAGPSGSGKSTLLRAINGLIPHSIPGNRKGEVWVNGMPVGETPVARLARHVATVFQDPAVQLVGLTVNEELEMARRRAIDAGASGTESLGQLGGTHLLERRTAELSHGEKQRVAIAAALAAGRQILLFDEPMAHLDQAGRGHFLELLNRLKGMGVTMVIGTHDPRLLTGIADKTLELGSLATHLPGPSSPTTHLPRSSSQPGDVTLRLQGVNFAYDGRSVLEGVSFEVRSNEIVGLHGPNGSGKSTIARLAAGLLRPRRGQVELPDTQSGSSTAPRIGYVCQRPIEQVFCDTVEEEVAFGPSNYGLDCNSKVILEQFNLGHLRHASPWGLSAGECQRLVLAATTSAKPRLLVLDEPTAGQDPRNAADIVHLLQQLREAGTAVLIVSHERELLETAADRVLALSEGRVMS